MTETEAAKEETPVAETTEAQDPPVEDTEMKTEGAAATVAVAEEGAKEEETTEAEPTEEAEEKKTPPSEVKATKEEKAADENGEETPMEVDATEAVKSEDAAVEEAPSTTEATEEPAAEPAETPVKSEETTGETPTPKRKRGRPRKQKATNQQVLIKEAKGYTTPQTKRARKSTALNSYSPTNFKTESEPVSASKKPIPFGRGTKLKDIPSVKANVDEIKTSDPVLHKAFRLLYGGPGGIVGRGPLNKKELKKNLLEFSGYLPPLTDTEGLTEEEKEKVEDQEDQLEEKFATKAHQFKIPLLKSLCDLFDISRTYAPGTKQIPDKEGLVDLLLDFLGAPNVSLTKSAQKRQGRGPSKSKSPKKSPKPVVLDENGNVKKRGPGRPRKNPVVEAVVEPEEEESEGEDEVIDGKTIPSEKKLRKWVKAYVNCFNLEKATTNHAIETASDKFGVDLVCKKEKIKDLLAEEMS